MNPAFNPGSKPQRFSVEKCKSSSSNKLQIFITIFGISEKVGPISVTHMKCIFFNNRSNLHRIARACLHSGRCYQNYLRCLQQFAALLNLLRRSYVLRRGEIARVAHGLLYKWTELLYLTCPHEADLLTLILSQKLTQYLQNFKKIPF